MNFVSICKSRNDSEQLFANFFSVSKYNELWDEQQNAYSNMNSGM